MNQQQFRNYNTYSNVNISVNDAVKVTSIPQRESFWIQVESIDNNTITGSVQNHLVREHAFSVNDIISFDKKNVKEHKLQKDRFDMSLVDDESKQRIMLAALSNMSIEEFDTTLNIRELSNKNMLNVIKQKNAEVRKLKEDNKKKDKQISYLIQQLSERDSQIEEYYNMLKKILE